MYQLGVSGSVNFLPGIDYNRLLNVRTFTSRDEVKNYFMHEVGPMMEGASDVETEKDMFHQANFILPWIQIINTQSAEKPCGSMVSN